MESNEDGDFNISMASSYILGKKKALHFHVRPVERYCLARNIKAGLETAVIEETIASYYFTQPGFWIMRNGLLTKAECN